MSEYSAEFVQITDLQKEVMQSMVDLYLSCYDGSDADQVSQDLAQKTEVLLVRWRKQLIGFTTLQIYYHPWQGQQVCVIFSGDTVIHPAHWGQQALAFNWISRAGQLQRQHPDIPVYWFLIVKGHRTFRYLPVFASGFYPHWSNEPLELKALADELAGEKFGADYNTETGIVEFAESRGHLKPDIALPDEREKRKPAVRFFLQRNPGYVRGHEMVCLYRFDEKTMKPLTRRLFNRDIDDQAENTRSPWQQIQQLAQMDQIQKDQIQKDQIQKDQIQRNQNRKDKSLKNNSRKNRNHKDKKQTDKTDSLRESQARYLMNLLNRNRETVYGRTWRFDQIDSVAKYQQRVPLVDYEDIRLYMESIEAGKQGVLFAEETLAFERTSGSTFKSKLIAYNRSSLKDFRLAILPWLADLSARYDLNNGSAYFAVSPATREMETTAAGVPVGLPDGAYLGEDVLVLFAQLSAVPMELATVTAFDDWQLLTLYYLVRRDDLELISVWSPTFLTSLIQAFESRGDELEQLLAAGGTVSGLGVASDNVALERFRMWQRTRNTRILWPALKVISCWASASSRAYALQLEKLFPGVPIQGKGLLSTEGVVTVPGNHDRPVPAINSGFFEFLNDAGQALLAHELEAGQCYEVVTSNNSGFYRYRTGDQVRCEGYENGLPVLEFTGRIGTVSDLVGEKLTDSFVADCLSFIDGFGMLIAQAGVPSRSAQPAGVKPTGLKSNTLPGYLLLLDLKEHKPGIYMKELRHQVEQALNRNPHYAYARKLGQLEAVSLVKIQDPLQLWLDYRQGQGIRAGDIKVPALSSDTDWLGRVLAALESAGHDQTEKRTGVLA